MPPREVEVEEDVATCEVCGEPETDCDCVQCSGYSSRSAHLARPDEICSTCERCEQHCDCWTCESCGDRFTSDSDHGPCSNCNRCYDCCECYTCESCGERVSPHHYCGNCDRCTDCCDCGGGECHVEYFDTRNRFHDAAKLEFKANPVTRFMSAEIEVDGVDESDNSISDIVRRWGGGICHDGSLSDAGFEINTAPAKGDKYVRQIQEICRAVNNASPNVNTSCGLHIHVDARDLKHYEIRKLLFLWEILEPTIINMVPRRRRTSGMCTLLQGRFTKAMERYASKLASKNAMYHVLYGETDTRRHKNKYNGARYYALNIHSWVFRGTVEFRLHHGTSNAEKIINWSILCGSLVDAANRLKEKDILAFRDRNGLDVLKELTPRFIHAWIDARMTSFNRE